MKNLNIFSQTHAAHTSRKITGFDSVVNTGSCAIGFIEGQYRSISALVTETATELDQWRIVNLSKGALFDSIAVLGAMDDEQAGDLAMMQFGRMFDAAVDSVTTTNTGGLMRQLAAKHYHQKNSMIQPWQLEKLQDVASANVPMWDGINLVSHGQSTANLLLDMQLHDDDGCLLSPFDGLPNLLQSLEVDQAGFDAIIVDYQFLPKLMATLTKTMNIASQAGVKIVNMTQTDPFKRKNITQIAVSFEMSDGQAFTILFNNPDSTPTKLAKTDTLVSWKMMLNNRDVTGIIQPNQGEGIAMPVLSGRIMKVVNKNSARFTRTQAKRDSNIKELAETESRIVEKTAQLTALDGDIEGLKQKVDEAQRKAIDLTQDLPSDEKLAEVMGSAYSGVSIKKLVLDQNISSENKIKELDKRKAEVIAVAKRTNTQLNKNLISVKNVYAIALKNGGLTTGIDREVPLPRNASASLEYSMILAEIEGALYFVNKGSDKAVSEDAPFPFNLQDSVTYTETKGSAVMPVGKVFTGTIQHITKTTNDSYRIDLKVMDVSKKEGFYVAKFYSSEGTFALNEDKPEPVIDVAAEVTKYLIGKSRGKDYVKLTKFDNAHYSVFLANAGVGGEFNMATIPEIKNWLTGRLGGLGDAMGDGSSWQTVKSKLKLQSGEDVLDLSGSAEIKGNIDAKLSEDIRALKDKVLAANRKGSSSESPEDKKLAEEKVIALQSSLRKQRQEIFDATDAANEVIDNKDIALFAQYAELFPKTQLFLSGLIGTKSVIEPTIQDETVPTIEDIPIIEDTSVQDLKSYYAEISNATDSDFLSTDVSLILQSKVDAVTSLHDAGLIDYTDEIGSLISNAKDMIEKWEDLKYNKIALNVNDENVDATYLQSVIDGTISVDDVDMDKIIAIGEKDEANQLFIDALAVIEKALDEATA